LSPSRKQSRADQREATRARLLRAGRRTFAKHGFDETSIAMVCREARTTHGALYHHFAGKNELFAAIVGLMFDDIAGRVMQALSGASGWGQVEAACRAYLDACADPEVQTIVFRDGPRVLPKLEIDDIDRAANEPFVAALLKQWIACGLIRPQPIMLLGRTLGAVFEQAGASIAASSDPAHARLVAEQLVASWVGALRRDPESNDARIATDRLVLQPWSERHLEALQSIVRDSEVRRFLFDGSVVSDAWIREALAASEARFASKGVGLWIAHQGERPLGIAGFLPSERGALELAVAVLPEEQRRGYGQEMSEAALREAQARGCGRIEATVDGPNTASVGLLTKLGFVRTGRREGPQGPLFEYVLPRE
jgi:RimJ/RimL family protein N-acetyltransferase